MAVSYEEATAVKAIDSNTYEVDLKDDWTVGKVPHGGYVTSIFMRTTAQHFSSTLAAQNQPHCLTLHMEFLRRTSTGPATLTVKHMKIGGQVSTVHVSLTQTSTDPETSKPSVREAVVAYVTHANLTKSMSGGLSYSLDLDTMWKPDPAPPGVDLAKLGADADERWERVEWYRPSFRRAYTRWEAWRPVDGPALPSIIDEWVRLEKGQRITQTSLGSVVDLFPLMIENFRAWMIAKGSEREREEAKSWTPFWAPTVVLNLDVKKVLPEEGVEWLFVRVRTKVALGGRMDLEIVVMDEGGDVVALSNHVIFVFSAARNYKKGGKGKDRSKI